MTHNKDDNLQKVQKFCVNDLKVKEILFSLAPDKSFMYNEDYLIKLSDKMFNGLKEIKFYIQETLSDFDMNNFKPHLDEMFKNYEIKLAEACTDYKKLEAFYKNNLSDMNPNIVQETGDVCFGYSFACEQEVFSLIQKTSTINELLHVIHSRIMNDENLYEKLPVVAKELTPMKYDCVLYGVNTEMANIILQTSAAVKDSGDTSIMSLNENQMIMMIRDKGHALSIQINRNDDNSYNVKYYIPKLCNKEMINNLRGVTKVNENSKYTVGTFDVSKECLGLELLHFISNVPTDGHMNFYPDEQDNTKYYDYSTIISEMDFPHLIQVVKHNPIIHSIDGFDDYMQRRYEHEVGLAELSQIRAIHNGDSLERIEELTSVLNEIKNLGVEMNLVNVQQIKSDELEYS